MAKKQHWARNLEGGLGRILQFRAEEQEILFLKIQRLENELNSLRKQYDMQDEILQEEIREEWSIEEITEAKEITKRQEECTH